MGVTNRLLVDSYLAVVDYAPQLGRPCAVACEPLPLPTAHTRIASGPCSGEGSAYVTHIVSKNVHGHDKRLHEITTLCPQVGHATAFAFHCH